MLIATQKEADAVTMIDARLASAPDDQDARWLLLHALFSQLVRNNNGPPAMRERFATAARAYINAKGVNATVADTWLASLQ